MGMHARTFLTTASKPTEGRHHSPSLPGSRVDSPSLGDPSPLRLTTLNSSLAVPSVTPACEIRVSLHPSSRGSHPRWATTSQQRLLRYELAPPTLHPPSLPPAAISVAPHHTTATTATQITVIYLDSYRLWHSPTATPRPSLASCVHPLCFSSTAVRTPLPRHP